MNPLFLGWRVLVPTAATLEGGVWDLDITWGVEKPLQMDPRPQSRITLCKSILRLGSNGLGRRENGGTHMERHSKPWLAMSACQPGVR